MTKPTAMTQISLGIHLVWSESSQCADLVAKDSRFLHADSKGSDRDGRMLSGYFVGFVVLRLKWYWKENLIRIKTLENTLFKCMVNRKIKYYIILPDEQHRTEKNAKFNKCRQNTCTYAII